MLNVHPQNILLQQSENVLNCIRIAFHLKLRSTVIININESEWEQLCKCFINLFGSVETRKRVMQMEEDRCFGTQSDCKFITALRHYLTLTVTLITFMIFLGRNVPNMLLFYLFGLIFRLSCPWTI